MEEIDKQKDVEYYSNTVNAWYTTKLERDRSILIISSGGLGVLITILNFYGVKNYTEMILYFLSMFLFTVSIITMIIIFQKNAEYLEVVIGEKSTENQSIIIF
ncbi:MAG: hypothetical protein PHR06_05455 [Candidatus Cloacimonetes bacterium]|nr:hypothetical protein [Candidatus Cloacimonadota bacterium]